MNKKKILSGISLFLLLGAIWVVNFIWFKPFSIEHFFIRLSATDLLHSPESLTHTRILEPYGLSFYNDDLDDISPAVTLRNHEENRQNLATLQAYGVSDDKRIELSKNILQYRLQHAVNGEKFLFHNYPLNQMFGVQSNLPSFMLSIHSISDLKSVDDYISRLGKFGTKLDQLVEGLELRRKQGVIPPRFVLVKVIQEMKGFVTPQAEEHVLVTNLLDKAKAKNIVINDAIKSKLVSVVKESVYPAYNRVVSYTEEKLLPESDDRAGVWKLPDGDAYYQYMLKHHTSTELTADEIHETGLAEVKRILSEMDSILQAEGYKTGSVAERMRALQLEERFQYPDTEEGLESYLNDYQKIVDDIDTGMKKIFGILPESPVRVIKVPAFKEKTSPIAYYNTPALDGSRPGYFYVNMNNRVKKYEMRTLAYHEAIPGHHFHLAVQQELKDIPLFRKLSHDTAYTEGWALYAEQLAWEYGYQDDPYNNLGRLQYELWRAVRLVVDTGMHYKRWTREQAIEYMESTTGQSHQNVVVEIERYIVMPGQACAYKIGQLKIVELREKAKSQLGKLFNISDFHDVILENGAVPLSVLEQLVDSYIQKTKNQLH